jgi:hypothetical protein
MHAPPHHVAAAEPQRCSLAPDPRRNNFRQPRLNASAAIATQEGRPKLRKLIAFDDDTFDKLKQLGRDRMATIQELADEAFADVLRKHGIPVDLKDALRKSAALPKSALPKTALPRTVAPKNGKSSPARKPKS